MSSWIDTDQMHPAERMSLVLLLTGAVALALSHCGSSPAVVAAASLDAACAARDSLRAQASAAPAASSAAPATSSRTP